MRPPRWLLSGTGWLLFLGSNGILLTLLLWPRPEPSPPIFDVQLHYNREAWEFFSPTLIINTLKELHVPHALVSSTPNEGTLKLREYGPLHIIPLLSLYERPEDRWNWFGQPDLFARLERDLRLADYRGIGEVHVQPEQTAYPAVRELFAFAADRNLVVHVHTAESGIRRLLAAHEDTKILWAHAGLSARRESVAELLDRFPNLYAELSHRADIAPNGEVAPEWLALFERHPERFMIGSGTYRNELWYQYRFILASHRRWLRQLPPALAERIAHQNARALFLDRP